MARSKRLSVATLYALSLLDFSVMDQFKNEVAWSAFEAVPKVIVIADKSTATDGRAWGDFIRERFNAGFHLPKNHLQVLSVSERVKLIPVASLPDVPGIFKGIFFTGFKEKHPEMGMVLDFARRLTRALGVGDLEKVPAVVLIPAGSVGKVEPQVFTGFVSDESTKQAVNHAVEVMLEFQK